MCGLALKLTRHGHTDAYLKLSHDGWALSTTNKADATLLKRYSGGELRVCDGQRWNNCWLSTHYDEGVGAYRNLSDSTTWKINQDGRMICGKWKSKGQSMAIRNNDDRIYCWNDYGVAKVSLESVQILDHLSAY